MPGPDEMNGHAVAAEDEEGSASEAQAVIDRNTEELRALEEQAPQHAAAAVNGPGPSVVTMSKAQQVEAMLDAHMRQIVGVMVRGILVSLPAHSPDFVCRSIARVTGEMLADSVRADLPLMLKHRAGIKEAFKAGVGSTKVQTAAAEMPRKR